MEMGAMRQAELVSHEHDWLLERLHSLDNCLENLYFYGDVCCDMSGFDGLLRRCKEIRHALVQHVPDEEEVFDTLGEERDLKPLLERLKGEHRVINDMLDQAIRSLEGIESADTLEENLFALQDNLTRLTQFMRNHMATENQYIFPRLAA